MEIVVLDKSLRRGIFASVELHSDKALISINKNVPFSRRKPALCHELLHVYVYVTRKLICSSHHALHRLAGFITFEILPILRKLEDIKHDEKHGVFKFEKLNVDMNTIPMRISTSDFSSKGKIDACARMLSIYSFIQKEPLCCSFEHIEDLAQFLYNCAFPILERYV